MAWIVPALAASLTTAGLSATAAGVAAGAIVGAGISGVAAGAMSLASGQTPWDDPGGFFAAQGKAIGLGAAGGALGPALGAAGEAMGIGSGVGTPAAAAGAPAGGVSTGGVPLSNSVSTMLKAASNGVEGLGGKLADVGVNIGKQAITSAGTGALGDLENPGRGALVGAAGAVASGGLQSIGQSAGILPSVRPEANFQPMGDTGGYSPDSASVMPPRAGYAAPPPGSTPFSTLAANRLGQYGVKAGTMGTRYAVNNALTPTPPQQQPGTYQSFGIRPYWEQPGAGGMS